MAFGVDDAIAIAGIGASLFGGDKANKAAKAAAEAQMAFQRESLQNRHQWEVKDLRAAGLNPVLSANSGAPGASGASYSPQNIAGDLPTNATNAINSKSMRSLQAAQLLATDASAKASLATAQNQQAQAGLNNVNAKNNSLLTPGLSFQAAVDNLKAKSINPFLDTAGNLGASAANNTIGNLKQMIANQMTNFRNSARPSPERDGYTLAPWSPELKRKH